MKRSRFSEEQIIGILRYHFTAAAWSCGTPCAYKSLAIRIQSPLSSELGNGI